MPVSWIITKNTATNTVRYETVGTGLVDLNQVQIGDYVNIFGTGFNINNRGSFEITNVEVFYVISTLHQAFELINPLGVPETALQTANSDLEFFRPTVQGIAADDGRTVVLSSTVDGVLEVSIPATTQAVNRTIDTGSYLHTNTPLSISRINRDKNGEVTVFYSGSPNPVLSVGNFVFIDDLSPTPSEYFRSKGVIGTWPASATTDSSTVDNVTALQEIPNGFDDGRTNFDMIKALNGDGLIVGGSTLVANVPTSSGRISRYHSVSTAVVSDASLADGANRYTYQWLFPDGATGNGTELNAAANITVGPAIGQVMINGGAFLSLTNYSTAFVNFGASKKYDPATNTTTNSGNDPAPFCGHTLNTLVDGRIISYGGAETIGNFLAGRNSFAGYIWNPATQAWPAPGFNDIATFQRRAHHASVELQNKKILFIGGLAGAINHGVEATTLAYWQLEDNTTTLTDSTGTYNLTTSGTTARVQAAKIGSGREFTQSSYAQNGVAFPAAVTAMLGEWTVEWWSCGASGTYPSSMSLSGLGDGTVVAHAAVPSTGVAANNILMQVGISSGSLFWKWENGTHVAVTGSAVITGHVVDHYNHFAVRKKFNGSTYDVTMFCNGAQIGQNLNKANASGGSAGWFSMAVDPPTPTLGFSGVLDDVRIEKRALQDEEILLDFFDGCASLPVSAGNRKHRIGRLHEYCETFDPTVPIGSSVQPASSMMLGRAYHTGTLLPDGRVLVIGGLAHDPSNFVADLKNAGPTSLLGPSASSRTSEFYDPATNQWTKGPDFQIRRHWHSAIYVPSRNVVMVIGGESTQGDDTKIIEFLDIKTMRIGQLSEKLFYQARKAILMDNNTILVATNQPDGLGAIIKINQLISLEAPGLSSKKIADFHRITGVGSGYFKFQTPTSKYYYSNFGKPNKDNVPAYTVVSGTRLANITTLTFAAAHQFTVGQHVYVNLQNPTVFGNGLKTILTVSSTDITYDEIGSDQVSIAQDGQVFKNFAPDVISTSWAALSNSIPGPYVLDPLEGVSISSIKDTVGGPLFAGIFKGQKYITLPVVNASVFPDSEGFIVLGFGNDIQTKPIKYFGRYNANGLLIDYNYMFENDIPSGTEVVLLSQRDPYVPTHLVGQFYATDSSAGRVAAEGTIQDIAAAGIEVNVTIVYPGDRGLGGEGLPANHAQKLSDKVVVWGGNDLDNEIAGLKE